MIPQDDKESQSSLSIFAAKPQTPYLFSLFPTGSMSSISDRPSSMSTPPPPLPQEYAAVGYYQEGYV